MDMGFRGKRLGMALVGFPILRSWVVARERFVEWKFLEFDYDALEFAIGLLRYCNLYFAAMAIFYRQRCSITCSLALRFSLLHHAVTQVVSMLFVSAGLTNLIKLWALCLGSHDQCHE